MSDATRVSRKVLARSVRGRIVLLPSALDLLRSESVTPTVVAQLVSHRSRSMKRSARHDSMFCPRKRSLKTWRSSVASEDHSSSLLQQSFYKSSTIISTCKPSIFQSHRLYTAVCMRSIPILKERQAEKIQNVGTAIFWLAAYMRRAVPSHHHVSATTNCEQDTVFPQSAFEPGLIGCLHGQAEA
jgi:hypothetical protein